MSIEEKCNHMILTKEEIFKKPYYDISVYAMRRGCFVTITMDSSAVWDMYKSYQKLGSVRYEFDCFWDYVHALVSYKM